MSDPAIRHFFTRLPTSVGRQAAISDTFVLRADTPDGSKAARPAAPCRTGPESSRSPCRWACLPRAARAWTARHRLHGGRRPRHRRRRDLALPPNPFIEITPVGRGIALTLENQILLDLMPEDIVPAQLLDLAGGAVVFTPAGSGYSREARALDWGDDIGDPVDDKEEIAPAFRFDFTGQKWESFFVSRYGLITFGEPYPFSQHGPNRWGTMAGIAEHLGNPPMIAVLYKPRLGGWSTYEADQFRNT